MTEKAADSSSKITFVIEDEEAPKELKESKIITVGNGGVSYGHSILPDLRDITSLPEDVKRRAETICNELEQGIRRKTRRKYLIFVCVYWAFSQLEQKKDPNTVASIIGINPREIQAAFSLFSSTQTKYKPEKKYSTAIDFLPDYCEKLKLEKDAVIDLAVELFQKEPTLLDCFPQTIASGILKYYAYINGIKIEDEAIAKTCSRSIATVSKLAKKVTAVHNA